MTPEEHQAEHVKLHRELDSLIACYLSQRSEPRTSIYNDIFALMQWSHRMTQFPLPTNGLEPPELLLVAQTDDQELLEWLNNAAQRGGGFIQSFANAALRADHENYPPLRPLLLVMRKKYPSYEPTESVKQEIKDRVR